MAMTPLSIVKQFTASFFPSYFIEEKYVSWYYPFVPKFFNILQESGYMHIQATKPDTIGAALTGNPVGLAAYILEKFSTWTNLDYRQLADGGFDKGDFSLDALLDNVMIYYLTNTITTSQRIYKEDLSAEIFAMELDRVPVETFAGCTRFKYELAHAFDSVLREKFPKLIQTTYHEHGGHFPAMQLPKVLYNDYLDFVRKTIKSGD
jgi:juvenile hormone epoxide hydrolase